MRIFRITLILALLSLGLSLNAQKELNPTVDNFVKEQENNSQLKSLAHELMDNIGPRLVGSPQMEAANDWAVAKFESWGIAAGKEQFGTWKAWERGISHIDMISPYVRSLDAMQLAWSVSTPEPIVAEVIAMPIFSSKEEFDAWLPKVKGKIVLMSPKQDHGRSDYQYKEYGTEETYDKIMKEKESNRSAWDKSVNLTGYNGRTLPAVIEENGALAVAISYWTGEMGSNRIFGTQTKTIPMIDISNEHYSQLYRLAESGKKPVISINVQSKHGGVAKTYNTIAEIRGKEKPNEYIILSAHLDSWDGATGATDNGTGTVAMMEAARMIKKYYPNNKRTILVCLWGSEEQGLNGSRAFAEDHPEIVQNIQAVFNFDTGTGRIVRISGMGFEKSYDFIPRWMNAAPDFIKSEIETDFPGFPGRGGSDHAAFVPYGVPAFMLLSKSWDYGKTTWHTTRDTYDKIVFDDLKSNAILAATLAYMASEEPEMVSREKRIMPLGRDGEPIQWPEPREVNRTSDYYFE